MWALNIKKSLIHFCQSKMYNKETIISFVLYKKQHLVYLFNSISTPYVLFNADIWFKTYLDNYMFSNNYSYLIIIICL